MSEDYLEDVNEDMNVDNGFDGFEDDLQDEELVDDGPSVYSEDGDLDETEKDETEKDEAGEYEEITSDEVDRIVETLEALTETVESENIKVYLEDAVNSIHGLIYEATDLESDEDEDLSQVA